MTPKLLIITTFYNEYERLKFTLDNMLNQESSDFVHLIIDDGSADNSADEIVQAYMEKCNHPVHFEKHENAGINMVHMHAFARTEEFGCTHFMWLDCGDGLSENAVSHINGIIKNSPEKWLHLNGYNTYADSDKKIKMSTTCYLPYLKKEDQFLPFCFSVSTYGHFVIPFNVYNRFNPEFKLVDGFYYDAQIVGALSLNNCPHHFVEEPLSIIQDDRHFSISNSSGNTYQDNLLKLTEFVISDPDKRERIAKIAPGVYKISINQLFQSKNYFVNRAKAKELKAFYKENNIKITDRYKWLAFFLISLFYFC